MLMKRLHENMWEIKNDTKMKIDYLKTGRIINPKNLYIDAIKLYLDSDIEGEYNRINVDKYKLKEPILFEKVDDGIWNAKIDFEVKYEKENQNIQAVCSYIIPNTFKLINLTDDETFGTYFYKSFSVRVCEEK